MNNVVGNIENSSITPYSVWLTTNFPVFTAFVWLLSWQIINWRALVHVRTHSTTRGVSWLPSGIVSLLLSLVQIPLLYLNEKHNFLFYLPFCLLSLSIGSLSFYNAWKIRALPKTFDFPTAKVVFGFLIDFVVVSLITTILSGLNISLNNVMLSVTLIPNISYEANSFTPLEEMINQNFIYHAISIGIAIIGLVYYVVVISLTYRNIEKYVAVFGHEFRSYFDKKMGVA